MRTHAVRGGGGLTLHVEETGRPDGKSVLFIHGYSQCRLVWNRQLHSDLADEFRLVAMDIRGHGSSEKPRDAYGDSRLWADDVHAVITQLGLERPALAGWSYGGVVILDYVQAYGEDGIAGTNFVGAISRLGEPLVKAGFLGPEFMAATAGTLSENVEVCVAALERLLRLCVGGDMPPEEFYSFLGFNVTVPPYVRRGMLARTIDHDAVIDRMRTPILVSYGDRDAVVAPAMGRHIAERAAHATLSVYADAGRAVFWEAPERFNRELRAFRESV